MEDSHRTNSAAADSNSTFRYTWLSRVIDAKMSAEALRKTITSRQQQRQRIHQQQQKQSPSHHSHYRETKEPVETRGTPTHADIRPRSADNTSEQDNAWATEEQSFPDRDNTSTAEPEVENTTWEEPVAENDATETKNDEWQPEVAASWTVDAQNEVEESTEEAEASTEVEAESHTGSNPAFNWNPTSEPVAETETEVEATNEGWSSPVNEVEAEAETSETEAKEEVSKEDQERLSEERIARIKKISLKLKTPSGIADLEDEPAYKRRNIQLDNVDPSNETSASRLTLGENEEGKTGLSSGNSFLHDNVD